MQLNHILSLLKLPHIPIQPEKWHETIIKRSLEDFISSSSFDIFIKSVVKIYQKILGRIPIFPLGPWQKSIVYRDVDVSKCIFCQVLI